MSRVLVIDDDVQLCELLADVLEAEGYDVECRHCGETALAYMQDYPVDLVLLDVMLPNIDGMQVARRICQRFATPILMLTALADEASMMDGLQAGADHYMPKPFRVPELLARMTAILRRVGLERQRQSQHCNEQNLSQQIARLPLTGTEFELLEYLIKNNEIVVSKAELQKEVLKKDLSPFDRNLDMHISNIRRKMVQSGLSKQHIKTIRGKGYSFLAMAS
ncbi:response regulator transcription factor [Photobacterium sanguinicancri]|uniref:DNA-binding response regulator n=1 Tax=Photobacterium sanguinicancri TaxID=875932 RepID=A0AAW7Y8K5_9GAMM|nr:response regulator transcription factor [Photobacterium sanguinicancri]KXI24526.1 two-component system response regulator [Photobacterium sanguinicancri]MDO6498122.1 response regulator transcription factor [Photobacterium sanguinicancri]MDO6544872.1 response regulator transcription factor [Photobacterium sanguinicancri]OZS42456.1 DNA-binding response regulator [Photobacterium sanguinicancri]